MKIDANDIETNYTVEGNGSTRSRKRSTKRCYRFSRKRSASRRAIAT